MHPRRTLLAAALAAAAPPAGAQTLVQSLNSLAARANAGTIGIVLLTFVAKPVASLAVQFRPEDYFMLALIAFASVTTLVARSMTRGLISLFLGILIGCVGIDQLTGQPRLTAGVDQLGNGVDIVIGPGTEIIVRGYQSKDKLCKPACKANGRDVTFPDGKKLFMGSSGTGAPKDGSDPTDR